MSQYPSRSGLRVSAHDEGLDSADPTTPQPLYGEPRSRFSTIAIGMLLLTVVVIVIFALTLL
jgi:hypothetical protein